VSTCEGNPLNCGYDGRYLTPWVTTLFQPEVASMWVVRYVTVLWEVLGIAGIVALCWRFFNIETLIFSI
jgi:hypothetical protein